VATAGRQGQPLMLHARRTAALGSLESMDNAEDIQMAQLAGPAGLSAVDGSGSHHAGDAASRAAPFKNRSGQQSASSRTEGSAQVPGRCGPRRLM